MMLAATALVVVAVVGWIVLAATARGAIVAVPKSLTCGDVPVTYDILGGINDDGVPTPAFELTAEPGTKCSLTIVIVNTGSRAVHVDTMEFPELTPGPSRGHLVMVSRDLESDTAPERDDDATGSAIFSIDQDVRGHASMARRFELAYRAPISTCQDEDYSEAHHGIPLVRTSSLGLSGTTKGAVNLLIRGTGVAGSDCG
ncbi:hypothetical protein C6I20_11960 [Aeromicrobium sp. A1-2]|nr:hypothetical protein C6I20_11960 [Aeromicrobium sp. A1-2]